MKVYIAEKPSLAAAIFSGLGGDVNTQRKDGYYQNGNNVVTWCVGHLLSICEPQDYNIEHKQWNIEHLPFPSVYPPKFKPRKGAEKQLKTVLSLMSQSTSLVHAGDPDSEGNLIVDEIITYANYKKPVERLLIADLNDAPVKKALANMKPNSNYKHLTLKALSRTIADSSVGINLTRAYTLKAREKGFTSVLNVGRVISTLIGIVNSVTLANQNHVKAKYYELFGYFSVGSNTVKAKLVIDDSFERDEKGRLISSLEAAATQKADSGASARVEKVETKQESSAAPVPFNLSSLQIEASKRFGYSASKTLEYAQSLYDQHKLLTYPRSDNQFLGESHFASADEILTAIAGTAEGLASATQSADTSIKHRCFNDERIEAHHAVIPTSKSGQGVKLSEGERNIYEMVAKRFIALFYPNSLREKTTVQFSCTERTYVANQTTLIKQGWEVLFKDQIETIQNDNTFDIGSLKSPTECTCEKVEIAEKETTPPKYFDEASLLSAMTRAADWIKDPDLKAQLKAKDKGKKGENGSIGTEATRAGHIEKLKSLSELISFSKEKGYKNPVFKTTKAGQQYCEILPDQIVMPDTSAIWEGYFNRIEKGTTEVIEFINEIDSFVSDLVKNVKLQGVSIQSEGGHKCPTCQQGTLIRRKSAAKGTFFHACNRYPDCKTVYPDDNGTPRITTEVADKPKASETEFCKSCGSALIRREGKKPNSFWWGCSGFPKCKVRFFDNNGRPDRDHGELN
ncbi:topoisomerase DNA-binding C4 zinc finger domain-containing protein [Vibrio cholerae]|uniref:DNA topoisomerase n=3 Tax=Vibrio TaxID=662 RepID=UPI001E5D0BFC|nr:DNA topoisomerase [Vibrio cholerae]MCD1171192.1 DNA topoisomerase III [Vibrio cholerae]